MAGMGGTEMCMLGLDDKTQKKGDCFENLDIDGRRVLKWILEEQDGTAWIGLMWLKKG